MRGFKKEMATRIIIQEQDKVALLCNKILQRGHLQGLLYLLQILAYSYNNKACGNYDSCKHQK